MTKPLDPIEATTATHAAKPGPQAPSSPATCANCGAVLAGEYCHECGQYAHNPLSSFRHAVEDVFESVWHLDGRIFRTLRNLFVPGLVAREYLSGHRVRYIPPLRLFVILSLLTFFVGRLVLHVDFNPGIRVGGEMISFDSDRSVAAVEQRRDRLLGKLREQEIAAARTPGASPTLIAARTRIQGESAARIAQLRGKTAAARASGTGTAAPDAATPATTGGRDRPPAAGDARGEGEADSPFDCEKLRSEAQDRQWMPGFADRWINARVIRGCENFKQADTQGERLFQAFLAAVPTVLFLLMPVFALLLKLLHLGSGRTYLDTWWWRCTAMRSCC